jgi:hypothetical protein
MLIADGQVMCRSKNGDIYNCLLSEIKPEDVGQTQVLCFRSYSGNKNVSSSFCLLSSLESTQSIVNTVKLTADRNDGLVHRTQCLHDAEVFCVNRGFVKADALIKSCLLLNDSGMICRPSTPQYIRECVNVVALNVAYEISGLYVDGIAYKYESEA